MRARRGKTVAQQCRYYEVDNIYEYMVDRYLISDFDGFRRLYKELCTDARKEFISYLFSEANPQYTEGIITATI